MLVKLKSYNGLKSSVFFLISLVPLISYSMVQNKWEPLTILTAGPGFSPAHEDHTLTLLPPWTNTYKASHITQHSGMLGLTLGASQLVNEALAIELGVSGYINTNISYSGHVWQFSLPEFDNFVYHYRINSNRLMGTAKIPFQLKNKIHPYVMGEIGVALNRTSHYLESPLIAEAFPMQAFTNASHNAFAWDAGLGVDMDISTRIRLGVGYLFIDAGSAPLGLSMSQATGQTLGVAHLYTHQILFQLTAFL